MAYINHALLTAVSAQIELDKTNKTFLNDLNKEATSLQQAIADGVNGIGKMMEDLAIFSNEPNQIITDQALSNDTVAQIGGLLQASGYLLNVLREASDDTGFYLESLAGIKPPKQ